MGSRSAAVGTVPAPTARRLLDLQREAGNQVVQRIVEPLALQRSCSCGGTCDQCAAAGSEARPEAADAPLLIGVQRAAPDAPATTGPVIVDDGAGVASGQMTKSQFLTTLRTRVTATAQAGFVGSTWTADDCPALGRWFGYYATKDAAHIERALRAYARTSGETADAFIDAACRRVALSVGAFVLTGQIVGIPAELAGQDLAEGGEPAALDAGGGQAAPVQREGAGEPLPPDGAQIATAMGVDAAAVRIHSDGPAAAAAARLDARAFTVGGDISFAEGALRPGTIEGDALLAHELAHVAQQSVSEAPHVAARRATSGGHDSDDPLEAEADRSAFATVAGLWGRARGSVTGVINAAVPRLRGGIRMQRCRSSGPSASDFLVEGVQASADPHMLMFNRNASNLDAAHRTKIKTTATAEKTNPLAIYGSASEDESTSTLPTPNALAERRMRNVDAALFAEGHTAARTLTNKSAAAAGTLDYRSVRRVEIQVGSVAVPVPPAAQEDCSVDVAKPCTAANTAALTAAVATGTARMNAAITKLGAAPLDAPTKDLVRRLFLSGNMAAPDADVVAKANAVKGKLIDWRAHLGTVMGAANHRCVKTCDRGCVDADAYNQDLGAAALKSFCATYFAKSPADQAETMVHECGHGTPSVDSDDIAYGRMRQIETLTEAEAMKNTDSYVLLIQNLAAPGSAQIGIADTFSAGMLPDEQAKARKAFSWTETWLNACPQLVEQAYSAAHDAATTPGGWTASFGRRVMTRIPLHFPGINPPTLGSVPTLQDRTRVAAIFDRYTQMDQTLWMTPIRIEKITSGKPGWDAGPGKTVRVDAAFFTLTDRERLEWLFTQLALATPGVSAAVAPLYVKLADDLRHLRSLGAP